MRKLQKAQQSVETLRLFDVESELGVLTCPQMWQCKDNRACCDRITTEDGAEVLLLGMKSPTELQYPTWFRSQFPTCT